MTLYSIILKPKYFGNTYKLKFLVNSYYNLNKPKFPIPADTLYSALIDLGLTTNLINADEISKFLNSFSISSSLIKYGGSLYVPVSPYLINRISEEVQKSKNGKKIVKYFRKSSNFVDYRIYFENLIDEEILNRYKLNNPLRLSSYWRTAVDRISGSAFEGSLRKESYLEYYTKNPENLSLLFLIYVKNEKYLKILEKLTEYLDIEGIGKNKATDFYGSFEFKQFNEYSDFIDRIDIKGKGILLSPLLLDRALKDKLEDYNVENRNIFLRTLNEEEKLIENLFIISEGSCVNLDEEFNYLKKIEEDKIRYFSSLLFKIEGV